MRLKPAIIFAAIMFWTACAVAVENADDLYRQAEQKYQGQKYAQAVTLLENAIALAPDVSRYHHLLGKCYGRMAETAGPLHALSLATQTRRQFEKAVELDGENVGALKDLMKYYQDAPGFLGGNREKALEIQKKLSRLQTREQPDDSQTNQRKDFGSSIM